MTRDEMIDRATDAILSRREKYEQPELNALQREFAREDATAALEAVGAFDKDRFAAKIAGRGCENYVQTCCEKSGRKRFGTVTAEQWCDACEAAELSW